MTDTPEFYNDIFDVIRLFSGDAGLDCGECEIRHSHAEADGKWIDRFTGPAGLSVSHAADIVRGGLAEKKHKKRAVKTACFLFMRELTGRDQPWGSLTGIRPGRLIYEAMESGLTAEEAAARLTDIFFVSKDKASLLAEVTAAQRGLAEPLEDQFDLYIGIPFCRTRCSYCAFASEKLGDGRLVEPYADALLREIGLCAGMMNELGLKPRACYVGGGTPTAIEPNVLERVIGAARAAFPGAREWTVEAGRPDSINRAALKALAAGNIGRISINPQTFSDETLARIGRGHTARETLGAFSLARDMGFTNINMDLIAALPGEGMEQFARTIEAVSALSPEGVTVHTLALKRASRLRELAFEPSPPELAAEMVSLARAALTSAGYRPYYLYRQKYMAGNLENVGYAKPGFQCLYNIGHMEETARVLALGAGGITKWLFPRERRIERAPNVRDVREYINRADEMAARKRRLLFN